PLFLHAALPIYVDRAGGVLCAVGGRGGGGGCAAAVAAAALGGAVLATSSRRRRRVGWRQELPPWSRGWRGERVRPRGVMPRGLCRMLRSDCDRQGPQTLAGPGPGLMLDPDRGR